MQKGVNGIIYDDHQHHYFKNEKDFEKDVTLPSVTTIINGNVDYIGSAMYEGHQDHSAIIQALAGNNNGIDEISEQNKPIYEALKDFKLIGAELVNGNSRIAGTIDLLAKDKKTGEAFGIDIKTKQSSKEVEQEVKKQHKLQAGGYSYIWGFKKFVICYANQVVVIEGKELAFYEKEFLDLLDAYEGKKQGYYWDNGRILKTQEDEVDTLLSRYLQLTKEIEFLEQCKEAEKNNIIKLLGNFGYKNSEVNISFRKGFKCFKKVFNEKKVLKLLETLENKNDYYEEKERTIKPTHVFKINKSDEQVD